jgi:hypothetical protein
MQFLVLTKPMMDGEITLSCQNKNEETSEKQKLM